MNPALLPHTVSKSRIEACPVTREITIHDSSKAIEMHFVVKGVMLRAILPEISLSKNREDLIAYAQGLGGRLANNEENYAIINVLLDKEKNETLNNEEEKLLKIYRKNYVRDLEGGYTIDGSNTILSHTLIEPDFPGSYALIILPTEQLETSANTLVCASLPAIEVSKLQTPVAKEYFDNRKGFEPHKAIEFNVKVNGRVMACDLLEELLGKDVDILMSTWGRRIDFNKHLSANNKVILFTESNRKARNSHYAKKGVKTTQEDDFKGAGLQFADDLEATIICVNLVKKAAGLDLSKVAATWQREQPKALSKMNQLEVDLLAKLRDGVVRTSSGSLNIDAKGCLRAKLITGPSNSRGWALGGFLISKE